MYSVVISKTLWINTVCLWYSLVYFKILSGNLHMLGETCLYFSSFFETACILETKSHACISQWDLFPALGIIFSCIRAGHTFGKVRMINLFPLELIDLPLRKAQSEHWQQPGFRHYRVEIRLHEATTLWRGLQVPLFASETSLVTIWGFFQPVVINWHTAHVW